MKIVDGRYTPEKWENHGINFKQYRLAVVIEDDNGFRDLVTTAIIMQMDGRRGYAVHLEGRRYLDSFGDNREEFLNDKIVKDFASFMASNEKAILKAGGRLEENMDVHVGNFVSNKLKLLYTETWTEAYDQMNKVRYEEVA